MPASLRDHRHQRRLLRLLPLDLVVETFGEVAATVAVAPTRR